MADKVGNLAIIISGDSKQFMQVMANVEQQLGASQARIEAKARQGGGGGEGAARFLAGGAKAFIGAYLGKEFLDVGKHAIDMSRDFEVAEAQLKTLTGSAEQAKEMMGELRTFAPSTPFGIDELAQVSRKLMGGGMGKDQSLEVTKRIAAVGAGTGGDISSLGRAYSQVTAAGRFMTEELNQFSDADFPIKEFANTARMSMGEFRDKMKDGLIPVTVMEDTFKRLTEKGGIFENALRDMADTATGRMKAEKAAQEAYLADRGSKLEDMGASGRQIGNWWERAAVDAQVFGAAVWKGIGDKLQEGGMKGSNLATHINWRLNPESSPDGIARMKAEHDRVIAERRELERTAEDRLGAQADRIAAATLALEREAYAVGQKDFEEFKNREEKRIQGMAGREPSLLDRFEELRAHGLGSSVGAASMVNEMRDTLKTKLSVKLPEAATFGSSRAEEILSKAMESSMSKDLSSVEDVLKAMKEIETKNNEELKETRKQLEKMFAVRPARIF